MLYCQWRFRGLNPAGVWRSDDGLERNELADPWPGRVDAFLSACAIQAGQRERDLLEAMDSLGEGLGKLIAPGR